MAFLQMFLVVATLVAPVSGMAADSSSSGGTPSSAEPTSQPEPDPSSSPTPTPTPTPEPVAEPSPEPNPSAESPSPAAESPAPTPETPAPTAEPTVAPTDAPTVAPAATRDFVVTFAPGTNATARASILADAGAEVVDTIAPLRMAVIRVVTGSSVVATLQDRTEVVRVEPDRVREAEAAPDDPGYADQWSLGRIGWDRVHDTLDPTGSVVVAVLDTGVDAEHSDLAGRLVSGVSLVPGGDPMADPNGHGTAMAGIIAAVTDNGEGIAGIGWSGVKVMPVTVLGVDGLGQDSDIIEGIVWAVDHGASVVNLSFSNPGYSAALQAAVDYAWDHDVVVVAATGNDGSSAPTYPAGDRGVVGVSNTNRADELDGSSNHGADTFLGAPGTDIATLLAGGGTTSVNGTSASSAEVAASAALLRAIDPAASNAVIVGRLARSAADVGTRSETGNGRLDLARAAADHGSAGVKPLGAAPTGSGGPFVGPYVAAAATVQATTTLNGSVGSISVAPGASITLVMFVNTNGASPANNWFSSRWALATSAPLPGAMTCVDHANHVGGGAYSETMTITAPAAAGTYNLYLYAYNGDACGAGQSALFTRANALDNVAPTVTINQAVGQLDPTNGATITFTVVFSEPVVGFATGDVSFAGSTVPGTLVGTVSGAGPTYTVAVTGMTGSGTVVASLAAGVAADPAGNANAASTSTDNTVTRDVVVPTVTINQAVGQVDPTNTSPILFTVVFSEPVTGFITGDVTFAGTAGGAKVGTVSGSGANYTVSVTGMTTSGTVIASIAASRAIDLAGNNNTASSSTDNSVTWDVTAPTVTINQAVGQVDPTNTSPITYTVVFSEPVTGFATGDVTFTGTAGGTKVGAVSGGPTTYTVSVTGMTTPGTVITSIAAGVATDLSGNANAVSTSADNSVTWDNVAPTVTINQAVGQLDPTNGATITFTVVFSEPVVGFATGDVSFAGSTVPGTLVGTVSGAGPTYTVAVTGMTGSGTVVASLAAGVAADPAGNANAASTSTDNTVTRDVVVPTVTINQAVGQVDPTNTSPILFTVVFSEPVTGFITGDVTFAGTAGGAKVGTVSGSGANYTVSVTGMTTSGTVIASIAASRAIDLAGNNNAASSSTDNSVTWDVTAPTVTINQAVGQVDPTNTSPITYTVVFSEPVTGFATGDVTFTGTAGGTKVGAVSGGPTTYTVSVTGMTTPGTVITSIAAGVATDLSGNANAVSTSADNSVTWDNVAPTVTINQAVGQLDPTNGATITFTVVFSEPVVGFATGDVSFAGSTVPGTLVGTVSGAGPTYTVAVTGMTGSGTVVASLAAGVAADPAGNANAASTSTDNTVTRDVTPPTATIDLQAGSDTGASSTDDITNATTLVFDVTFSESVTGLLANDFSNVGTATTCAFGAPTGAGTTYTVTVTGCSQGTVIVRIRVNAVTDVVGNNNAVINGPTVTIDRTGPTVTINQAVGQVDPTNASPILYTVVFSEPVTGFATGDVSFTGSTSGGAKVGTVSGGPTTYTVSVTGMTTPGTVIATIGAGVATDLSGNANVVSTSTDNTVAWDATPPTVTINQAVGQVDPTNASPITFTVVFSETVTGFATGDVSFTGSTVGGTLVGTVSGGPTTYTVAVTGMTGSGTVVASLGAGVATDATGNGNVTSTSTDNTVTFDNVAPTVTINQAVGQADPTNTSPILYTVVFSEPVIGFATGDVTFAGSTSGGTKVDTVSGSGANYTVTVTGMTTSGSLIAAIAASQATDLAGNNNAASTSSDNTVTWDVTAPTVTINQAVGQVDPTNASPITFTVVFSEPVTGFATGDVTFTGTAGGTKVGTVSGSGANYTVTVTGMTISGTVIATIAVGVAADLAGNGNTASTSTDNTVTWNRATHLGFGQGPTDAIYRSTISPAVTVLVLDDNGFVVTESSASVSLTLAPAGPTLGGTVTVAAVNGIATFNDLTVDQVGTYSLNAASAGLIGTSSATFSILPAPLTITATDQFKIYGQTLAFAGTEFTVSGLLGPDSVGGVTLTSPGSPATASVVGSPYPITPSNAVGAGLANYTITYLNGQLTVLPAVLVVIANDRTKTYGQSVVFAGTEFSVFGLVNTDTVTSVTLSSPGTVATATVAGSPYPITPSSAIGSGLANYVIFYGPGQLTVTPAPLAITANDRTKTYGQTVVFAGTEFSTSGLLNADTVTSVSLASSGAVATATVAGSPYPITPSAAVGSGLSNYAITYLDGEMGVTAAPLAITADDRTKTYGQTVTFAGTEFSTSGLLNADTVTSVSLASPGAVDTATVVGSPYPITPSAAVGTGLGNYTITYVDGELTVTPATAVIVVTGFSVTYDALPHTATGSVTGVFGENLSAGLDLSATTRTNVGLYSDPWTFTDPAGNYLADSGTVDSDISQAALTITADDATKTYGQAVTFAGTEFSTSGLLGTDTVTSVTLASPGASPTATVAGSPYPITPSAAVGSGLANYAISYVDGALTVMQAALTVTAADQTKPFGVTFVFAGTEFSTVGLVNGDTVDSATLTSAGSPALAAPTTYPILLSNAVGTGLANYAISYVAGTLTVGNTAPVIGDASVTTDAMTAVSGAVTVTDPDTGQTVTLTIATGPANGTATVAGDGSFVYTPTGTFTGRDSFSIQGCDDALIPACDTGTVDVEIIPVAVADTGVTTEGKTIEVDVEANDIGDAGPLQIVGQPAHGTATIGSIIYTPDAGFSGVDQVVYRICSPNDQTVCDDGTLTITVNAALPDTDAGVILSTPLGPVRSGSAWLAGILALLFAVGAGAAVAIGRRRRDVD